MTSKEENPPSQTLNWDVRYPQQGDRMSIPRCVGDTSTAVQKIITSTKGGQAYKIRFSSHNTQQQNNTRMRCDKRI